MALESFAAVTERLRSNIDSVMVGKASVIEMMLVALLSEGHVLIEDVPGIGKTTLAKAIARSLGCTFGRIQFTPDLMPADIVGTNVFNQRTGEFELRPGRLFAQIVLADEVNRATPRTQSALLEAMQENQVTIEGTTLPLPRPFVVLATQNPIELEGTFPLPEAQIDRFLVRVRLGYPTAEEEGELLLRFSGRDPLAELQPVVTAEELLAMTEEVNGVDVEPSLRDYIVALAQATRSHPALELGASPRATLALYRTAQALAALRGRRYVVPDDVKYLLPFVFAHRMILTPQTRLRGLTAEDVLAEVARNVPVPVAKPARA
ncbi:MAG: MoxR family ATPase [Chloroflexi bacterium]|nr:MoxR family ATPase [Chloroflexota bacterium]